MQASWVIDYRVSAAGRAKKKGTSGQRDPVPVAEGLTLNAADIEVSIVPPFIICAVGSIMEEPANLQNFL